MDVTPVVYFIFCIPSGRESRVLKVLIIIFFSVQLKYSDWRSRRGVMFIKFCIVFRVTLHNNTYIDSSRQEVVFRLFFFTLIKFCEEQLSNGSSQTVLNKCLQSIYIYIYISKRDFYQTQNR